MPRQLAENQRIRDERHEQILRAAASVFARKGLAATKITDIAAAAGVSHGLMYHYFASKEDVFRQLVTRALQGIEHVLRDAREREGTVTERLRWLTAELVEGASEGADYALVIEQATISDTAPDDIRVLVQREPNRLLKQLSQLLREGQSTGEIIAGDPHQLALFYLACIQGIVTSGERYANQYGRIEPELLLQLFQAR